LNDLGGRVNQYSIPQSIPHSQLAQEFNNFFVSKVAHIRSHMSSQTVLVSEPLQEMEIQHQSPELVKFNLATPIEIKRIFMSLSNSSCEVDAISPKCD
jgi:hypothetical protein